MSDAQETLPLPRPPLTYDVAAIQGAQSAAVSDAWKKLREAIEEAHKDD